jgi:glycosyltransferase involved in cell wall biosynthesis
VSAERGVGRAALMIYIEPTPYVLTLIRRITSSTDAPVDVLFIAANVSQAWDLSLEEIPAGYLPRGTLAAVRAIAAKLASVRYGVVHLAGWGHPVLLGAMIVARLRGFPVAVETDSTLPVSQPWPKHATKRLLYPIMLRLPAVFLPGGTRQKRYLQHYGVPESRIVVAQMTVDVAAIANAVMAISPRVRQAKRAAMGIAPDECVFLFVGRLDPAKGIAVLLEAFSRASARNGKVRLHVAGDGILREMVKSTTASSARIDWAGRLTGPALLDAYATADAFVLPSLFEPWGLVVNEAMAAGLPVVASDRVGCVDDLVIDGQTGVVIEANRPTLLADAMMRLADDAPLRRTMGAAGRERIAGWTIEAEAHNVTDAWRRVSRA